MLSGITRCPACEGWRNTTANSIYCRGAGGVSAHARISTMLSTIAAMSHIGHLWRLLAFPVLSVDSLFDQCIRHYLHTPSQSVKHVPQAHTTNPCRFIPCIKFHLHCHTIRRTAHLHQIFAAHIPPVLQLLR